MTRMPPMPEARENNDNGALEFTVQGPENTTFRIRFTAPETLYINDERVVFPPYHDNTEGELSGEDFVAAYACVKGERTFRTSDVIRFVKTAPEIAQPFVRAVFCDGVTGEPLSQELGGGYFMARFTAHVFPRIFNAVAQKTAVDTKLVQECSRVTCRIIHNCFFTYLQASYPRTLSTILERNLSFNKQTHLTAGCTFVALIDNGDQLIVISVGDSPSYLITFDEKNVPKLTYLFNRLHEMPGMGLLSYLGVSLPIKNGRFNPLTYDMCAPKCPDNNDTMSMVRIPKSMLDREHIIILGGDGALPRPINHFFPVEDITNPGNAPVKAFFECIMAHGIGANGNFNVADIPALIVTHSTQSDDSDTPVDDKTVGVLTLITTPKSSDVRGSVRDLFSGQGY